jgi:hypothetical protein
MVFGKGMVAMTREAWLKGKSSFSVIKSVKGWRWVRDVVLYKYGSRVFEFVHACRNVLVRLMMYWIVGMRPHSSVSGIVGVLRGRLRACFRSFVAMFCSLFSNMLIVMSSEGAHNSQPYKPACTTVALKRVWISVIWWRCA